MIDGGALQDRYDKHTTYRYENATHIISCDKGWWSVEANSKTLAEGSAMDCFVRYDVTGVYD